MMNGVDVHFRFCAHLPFHRPLDPFKHKSRAKNQAFAFVFPLSVH